MTRLLTLALITLSAASFAAPECNIDARPEGDRLVNLVSGSTAGFAPKIPIFVTVTNGGKEYTTQTASDGKWALVYANLVDHTDVLCFQGPAKAKGVLRDLNTP